MERLIVDLTSEYSTHTFAWSNLTYRSVNFTPEHRLIVDGITTDITYVPELMHGMFHEILAEDSYKETLKSAVQQVCAELMSRPSGVLYYMELVDTSAVSTSSS